MTSVIRSSVRHVSGTSPRVLDSAHSGTHDPDDFDHACAMATLRRAEDTHVDKLCDFAPALGGCWIEAFFARSDLDANRNTPELDASLFDETWPHAVSDDTPGIGKVRLGKGLIWRTL